MQVSINGQNIDISLENEKTLGDFLKAFEENCAANDATIIGIIADGQTLSAGIMEDYFSKNLEEIQVLELSTVRSADIQTSLQDLSLKSAQIAKNLCLIPLLYQTGKDSEAFAYITEFADFFNIFCRTISLSSLFPATYGTIQIQNKSISEFLSDFSAVLSDFEKALHDNDVVLVGDLAEYEIAPRLESFSSLTTT